ncbi:MAG: CHRD domain-containing protein [Bacteroidota bacterium]
MRLLNTLIFVLALLFTPALLNAQDSPKSRSWNVTLAGFKEIPKVATSASGTAIIKLQGDSLFVTGSFQDLTSSYRSAHIFRGIDKEVGNAILALKTSLADDKRSGRLLKRSNRFKLNAYQKAALLNGELYISIASSEHPYGEIRSNIK